MQSDNLIAIEVFCFSHKIEVSFLQTLQQNGLIEITIINDQSFIDINQLQELEKIIRLYYELDINIEGIEAITHLLNKMSDMNNENIVLRNNLNLFTTE